MACGTAHAHMYCCPEIKSKVRPKKKYALSGLFLHLTTKERPRHVYSDLKPFKQIIGHKITYNVMRISLCTDFLMRKKLRICPKFKF